MQFNFFGRTLSFNLSKKDNKGIVESSSFEHETLEDVQEVTNTASEKVYESYEVEGNSKFGEVTAITEEVHLSHKDVRELIDANNTEMKAVMDALRSEYNDIDTYKENEEMAKDPIIGSAMELMCDDSFVRNPVTQKIVKVESDDKALADFLNEFLENNIKIDKRGWEWIFEIIKHGDFKLRVREYIDENGGQGVYYENVTETYKVSRIEYLGEVLGFLDEEENKKTLLPPDSFVHFMSTKLPCRKKITVKVRKELKDKDKKNGSKNKDREVKEITCYKVSGSSLVDNARYIFRVVRLLDDMLIMSRVARSTQYNIVKVEVGNAGPQMTQEILQDVRRRIEGSTKMTKGKKMRSDPSPIPVNSNVYLPTREGKGDVTIESVNENVDVKAITDIEHFRNKEFATIKVPKPYLGYEECLRYNTEIPLLNGEVYEIGYMAEHADGFIGKWVWSCGPDGRLEPTKILHVKKTRRNATFVRVTLDNGKFFDVTPDHLCQLRNGSFAYAGDLVSGDSLMPYYIRNNNISIKEVNHKVVKVELLDVVEDAYDLGVESENHTFPIMAGVFVHNSLPGSLGNTNLIRLDIRYSRTVQRCLNIFRTGLMDLCNHYLKFRGRSGDIGKFKIVLREVTFAEDAGLVEDMMGRLQILDSLGNFIETHSDLVDKPKMFLYIMNMIGIDVGRFATEEFLKLIGRIKKEEEEKSLGKGSKSKGKQLFG